MPLSRSTIGRTDSGVTSESRESENRHGLRRLRLYLNIRMAPGFCPDKGVGNR